MPVETIRFAKKEGTVPAVTKLVNRHSGLLQDQVRRSAKGPWCPSFSLALRILLLVRVSGAMYSNISDCDEVYNFWEPLHHLAKGYGFQTWELSPEFAIRSWAYVFLHLYPATVPPWLLKLDKRASFFALRIVFAIISSVCEAKLYRTIMETVNHRVGRYFFFIMLSSAGMWSASTAFLPSTFAMYTTMLAFTISLHPPSTTNSQRTLAATVIFATGAIVGWPFALALAIPFVLEELVIPGLDSTRGSSLYISRFLRLAYAGLCAALVILPVVGVDTLAYGRLVVVPWNIILYNIFGGADRGPELYGTEPFSFYFSNLLLNFNVATPLALLSLPALCISHFFDRKRLSGPAVMKSSKDPQDEGKAVKENVLQSSPITLLAIRLAPFYAWFSILTRQSHKEERFMFPAYPLLAFNAAVTLYLARGWMEVVFIKATKSPYKASKTNIFSSTTLAVVCTCILLSVSRIRALYAYYHAPLELLHTFHYTELPRVLNATGLLPVQASAPAGYKDDTKYKSALVLGDRVGELNLTLCYGKEWHRFPSHWLVPDGVNVEFIKSEFDGLLPRHFVSDDSPEAFGASGPTPWWQRKSTRYAPDDLNDLNKEDPSHYVDVKACHYLVDLDLPTSAPSKLEPRYVADTKNWEIVECRPFLDAAHSPLITRALWAPLEQWQNLNTFGDYCLLKKKDFI